MEFADAIVLIAGLERQRLTHDQPTTAARAVADVREGFRFIVDEPLLGPLTFLLVAWVEVLVVRPHQPGSDGWAGGAAGDRAGVGGGGGPCRSRSAWSGREPCRSSTPPTTRAPPEELLGRVNGTSFAMVLTALPFSSLAFGWLINATSPETAIAVVVAANAVMVSAFALIPAMRLIDQPVDQNQQQDEP